MYICIFANVKLEAGICLKKQHAAKVTSVSGIFLKLLNLCFLRKFYRTCVPPLCLRLWFPLLVQDIIALGRLLSGSSFSFFEKAKGLCAGYCC